MTEQTTIRLGTRGSPLAKAQSEWVAAALRALGHGVVLVPIVTSGDQQQSEPPGVLAGVGTFTKEIQQALTDRRVDLAVHSMKDLPTEEVPGLRVAAVPSRESAADVLIGREGKTLAEMPPGARIGTSSPRRRTQLLHRRPDLALLGIRGNVDTRLRKLDEGKFDAIVLAEAGLRRLGLGGRITEVLSMSTMLPAVGQGALALETRSDDDATRRLVAPLDDPLAHAAVIAERSLLRRLRAGCLAPVAGWARPGVDGRLAFDAAVLSGDGAIRLVASAGDTVENAAELGRRVADDLLRQGAAELITAARSA